MYEPEYRPPYLALVVITIVMICRGYVSYKDCRLHSLYGDECENMTKMVDEVRENKSIEFFKWKR